MNEYWNRWNDRERFMVLVGGACSLLYLCYVLIYAPLTRAVAEQSQQLIEKHDTLVWMREIHQHHQVKPVRKTQSTSQLLSVLADAIGQSGFKQYPYQLQQIGDSDIQLIFDKVPYALFMAWAFSMQEQYAISIKQWRAEHTDTPGVVKVMMVWVIQ